MNFFSPACITSLFFLNFIFLQVQPNNYANFYDNQKQNWSVLFDTSEASCSFAKNVALAMANSGGVNQLKKLIIQDLILGEGNELAIEDSAEMKYTGWFLSNYSFGKVRVVNSFFFKCLAYNR